MNALTYAILATETDALPLGGWGILLLGLIVTIAWLASLYR